MSNKQKIYFEEAKHRKIIPHSKFKGGDFRKSFAADSHMHSFTHAFGEPEEREGLWCLKNPVEVSFIIKDIYNSPEIYSRYFLKIIGMIEKWRNLTLPIEIELNKKTLLKKFLFFENVCKGWPANYLFLPQDILQKGRNTLRIINRSQDNYLILHRIEITERGNKKKGAETGLVIEHQNDKVPLWTGGDTDDVRLDESGELEHFLKLLVETEMGNFIIFRPKHGRNYAKAPSASTWKRWVNYCEENSVYFKITTWPLPGDPFSLEYIKKKKHFQGIHVHESYLLLQEIQNPRMYKEKRKSSVEKFARAKDFNEAKRRYIEHIKEEVKDYRKKNLPISWGEPSLLASYLPVEPGDAIEAEPATNVSLLFGAVRSVCKRKNLHWGVHIPIDWYLGFPHDKAASRRFKLMLNLSYIYGANWIYAENSLLKTNAYERFDEEDEFSTENRNILRNFYRYSRLHPRKGKIKVPLGAIYGNLESMLWYPDDRIPELKDTKNWDNLFWGKWKEFNHRWCWRALDGWLPPLPIDEFKDNPSILKLFSATPFGQVDIVPVDANMKFLRDYKCLVFLGWNTMTGDLYHKITEYVKSGGTLYICGCHLDTRVLPSGKHHLLKEGKVEDLIGAIIEGKGKRTGDFEFLGKKYKASENFPKTCELNVLSAEIMLRDFSGVPLILGNSIGKGKVYFGNFRDYPYSPKMVEFNTNFLRFLARETTELLIKDNEEAINYTLWEEDRNKKLYLVNVDWKKKGNKKKCFLNLWNKKFALDIKEGEIKEVIWNEDIGMTSSRNAITLENIRRIGNKEYEVEVIGKGNTEIELFLNGGGVKKVKQGEEKIRFDRKERKFRIKVNGKGTLKIIKS